MMNTTKSEALYTRQFSLEDCLIEEYMHEGGGSINVIFGNEIASASIHLHKKHIKINKLGVENEYRGYGVGKMLMQYIIKWCNTNKVYTATVKASSGITEDMINLGIAKGLTQLQLEAFYRSFGFVEQRGEWLHIDFGRKSLFQRSKSVFYQTLY